MINSQPWKVKVDFIFTFDVSLFIALLNVDMQRNNTLIIAMQFGS